MASALAALSWRRIVQGIKRFGLNTFLLVVILLLGQSVATGRSGNRIVALDVGQGDAFLIELDSGVQLLIDGGAGDRVLGELSEQLPWGDHSLDWVLASHHDQDHIEGLIGVLEHYAVQGIIEPERYSTTQLTERWAHAAEAEGGKHQILTEDLSLPLDAHHRLQIIVPQIASQDTNDHSLLAFLYQDQSCIAAFTGDAPIKVEQWLLAQPNPPGPCRLLKLGHHGSDTSTSQAFLHQLEPGVVVIGVGADNRYGHPSPEVLERIASYPTWRTDRDSSVVFGW